MFNSIIIIYSDIIAHRESRENPVQRMEEQQRDLLHHREARSDPQYQAREQQINNTRRQQVVPPVHWVAIGT